MKRLFVFIFLALRICCGQSWAAIAPTDGKINDWVKLGGKPLWHAVKHPMDGLKSKEYEAVLAKNLGQLPIPATVQQQFLSALQNRADTAFTLINLEYGFIFDGVLFGGDNPGEATALGTTRLVAIASDGTLPAFVWSMDTPDAHYDIYIATACGNVGVVKSASRTIVFRRATPVETLVPEPGWTQSTVEPTSTPRPEPLFSEPTEKATPAFHTQETQDEPETEEAKSKWQRAKLELIVFSTFGMAMRYDPIVDGKTVDGMRFLEGFAAVAQKFRHEAPGGRTFEVGVMAGVYKASSQSDSIDNVPPNPYFSWKGMGQVSATLKGQFFTSQVSAEYRFGKASETLFRARTRWAEKIWEAELAGVHGSREFPPYDVAVDGGSLRFGVDTSVLTNDRHFYVPFMQNKLHWGIKLLWFAHIERQEIKNQQYAIIYPEYGGPMIEAYHEKLNIFVEILAERTRTKVYAYSPIDREWKKISDSSQWEIRGSISKLFTLW